MKTLKSIHRAIGRERKKAGLEPRKYKLVENPGKPPIYESVAAEPRGDLDAPQDQMIDHLPLRDAVTVDTATARDLCAESADWDRLSDEAMREVDAATEESA